MNIPATVALGLMLTSAPAVADTCAKASWYADNPGGRTGCGERYNPNGLTAASYHYPCGTRLRVTLHGRSVVVRVNDRGPARRLHRLIDLSRGAAAKLHMLHAGVAAVQIKRLPQM